MINLPWILLAADALRRMQARLARRDTSELAMDGWLADEGEPGLTMPADVVPAKDAAAARAGGDPRQEPNGAFPHPPVPLDKLIVLLRLCAALGSHEAVDAMLRPRALTLLDCGELSEDLVREILVDGLLPDGTLPSKGHSRDVGAGSLCLFSVRIAAERYYRSRFENQLTSLLSGPRPILLLITGPDDIPAQLRPVLPEARTMPPLSGDLLSVLLSVTHGSGLSEGEVDRVPDLPADTELGAISMPALLIAFREPTLAAVVARLRGLAPGELAPDPAPPRPILEDIEGYGEAEIIARRMIADLQAWQRGEVAWSEVQRSVIFFGPPGTGKTFLAQAMANTVGVTLVRGGFAQWQARGHLGHMLAGMRGTFAEARDAAPAILVIDEIDSVGSRTSRDEHNASYRRQVINAFLEELDGLGRMEGVLLVGTCNAPSTIDPAVLRPGRIDVMVEVPLPGRAAIARMLRDGYPGALADDELRRLVRAASGQTAAAIDGALRAAKSTARAERRPVQPDDVSKMFGLQEQTPAVWHRTAIHECGHAIVATALGVSRVRRVTLGPTGGETWSEHLSRHGVLREFEADLMRNMAGRAAEHLILGDVSSGAGGSSHSDLAEATRLAAMIDMRFGLGAEGSVWRGGDVDAYLTHPEHAARIRKRLADAQDHASAILKQHRDLLLAMAEALLAAGMLDGSELENWTARVIPSGSHG